ncbi:MAG: hypothetical protein EAY81_07135 [Bacteroidetes bacterium]|nr:MAG: hypothetical protein EAY81_07135 [Bacteroidota bacterium]
MKNQRLLENLHLPLWIIKDTCWMLQVKWLAIAMIAPTIGMAIYIVYISRKSLLNFWPNLSVLCWISANAIWMLGEFLGFSFQLPSSVLFIIGLVGMGVYFIIYNRALGRFNKGDDRNNNNL